jgi:hypothetical protein
MHRQSGCDQRTERRVIVPRNREIHLVRIAVRVHQADHGDAEPPRLLDCDPLLLRIDDVHGARYLLHALDAQEHAVELVHLALQLEDFLLREGLELPSRLHVL